MRLAICAGPATTGKTSVLRHMIRQLLGSGDKVAFLKIDVQFAEEDEQLAARALRDLEAWRALLEGGAA